MPQENDSFETLFEQNEEKETRKLSPGQKISAQIVGIDGETIFLDVGLKSEGIIETAEFRDQEGKVNVAVGDIVPVYFLKSTAAEQLFTTSLGSSAAGAHLEEAFNCQIPVTGTVRAEIKGGFEVTLSGTVKAFCPYSQMGLRRREDAATAYLGTHKKFLITRFEENGKNIVLSARKLEEEEQRLKKEALKESLTEGAVVDGTISSIRQFGLFVDIGGVDGLVPLSEIGWSRVENLEDTFSTGQQVTVAIKGLDWENDRISLSIKETIEDPWTEAIKTLGEGSTRTGTVSRLAPFGAFITLTPGVDGLIHISKLGQGRRINHPREVLEEQQQIEIVIESIDVEKKRISLAPSDYETPEQKKEKEHQDFRQYQSTGQKEKPASGMGSLGALLKAKMDEKKK